jgi:hypothetical protein
VDIRLELNRRLGIVGVRCCLDEGRDEDPSLCALISHRRLGIVGVWCRLDEDAGEDPSLCALLAHRHVLLELDAPAGGTVDVLVASATALSQMRDGVSSQLLIKAAMKVLRGDIMSTASV